jgi:hypothetical protein
MAADTNALMNDAKCIEQCMPRGMQLPVLISLFAQIAGVSVDTNSLIDGAKCIEQCVPQGFQLPILISLLNQIVSGGGSISGGGNVTCGAGVPTSTPSSGCGIYQQTDSIPPGLMWQYYSGAWH